MNQLAAYTASYETAFTARQSALNAAVASNAAPTAASAAAAAQAAQQFSAQLWTALANYQAYSATLAGLYSQLAVYRQYLTGAEPAAKYRQTVDRGIWYDYETTFYSSTDSARYQAFLSVAARHQCLQQRGPLRGQPSARCAAWTTSSRRTMPPAGRPCRQARAATC